jgi:hypothetical protein
MFLVWEEKMQLSVGDQRALANRIAQKMLQDHSVYRDGVERLYVTEHELTNLIAGEIKEFFGE